MDDGPGTQNVEKRRRRSGRGAQRAQLLSRGRQCIGLGIGGTARLRQSVCRGSFVTANHLCFG
jgi:hypothetical protein